MTVLCVNSNPAIDKTLIVDNFQLSAIHRPLRIIAQPGGKGVNVARGLKTLGESVITIGWVGGHAGDFIEERLLQEGIQTKSIHTHNESRECISILDTKLGTLTEIYEKGEVISQQEVDELIRLYKITLNDVELVTLSGSLPPGVPNNFYSTLILLAKEQGIPALLDTSGEILRETFFQSHPTLIKPNLSELMSIESGNFSTLQDIAIIASSLSQRTGSHLAISNGEEGLVYAQGDHVWHAIPPKVNAVSPVGSGDCLLAGLAIGIKNNLDIEDMLKLAVAMGAANTLTVGAGIFTNKDVDELRPQVKVHQILGSK